jgi:hypothetical protein
LDQQLCRWLLLSLDRLEGNELKMTQELISNMLGVRREGVTESALHQRRAAVDLRHAVTVALQVVGQKGRDVDFVVEDCNVGCGAQWSGCGRQKCSV